MMVNMNMTYLIIEISIAALSVGLLLWANYKYNIFINVVSVYGVIIMSPFILLGTILFGLMVLIQEKNGMCEIDGCYHYQKLTWIDYLKFKFTGEGRKYACEG